MKNKFLLIGVLCCGIYLTSCEKKTPQDQQIHEKEFLVQLNYLDEVSQMQINTQTFIKVNTPWMNSLTSSLQQKIDLADSIKQTPIENVGLKSYANLEIPPMSISKQQREDFKITIGQYLKDFSELKNNNNQISSYLNHKQFSNDNWGLGSLLLETQQQTKENLQKQNFNLYELIHKQSLYLQQDLAKTQQIQQPEFLAQVQYLQINNVLNWLNSDTIGQIELEALEKQVKSLIQTTQKNKNMPTKTMESLKLKSFNSYQDALDQQLQTIDQAILELLQQGFCNATTQQKLINGQKTVLASFNSYLH